MLRSSSSSGVRKGAWTEEEDRLLRNCIQKYGEGKWHQTPQRAGLNRCRKSCRLRWLNYLRPNIKRGNFDSDEIDLIIRLHKLLGNRWSLIAGRLPGRTANDVKNYWNTHMKKKEFIIVNGGGSSRREAEAAGCSSCRKTVTTEIQKTTAATIIKPRPLSFSKNSPWLREMTIPTSTSTADGVILLPSNNAAPTPYQVIEDPVDRNPPAAAINIHVSHHEVVGQKIQQPDHHHHQDMQWVENFLNDHCNNTITDIGDDRMSNLWLEEQWFGFRTHG